MLSDHSLVLLTPMLSYWFPPPCLVSYVSEIIAYVIRDRDYLYLETHSQETHSLD